MNISNNFSRLNENMPKRYTQWLEVYNLLFNIYLISRHISNENSFLGKLWHLALLQNFTECCNLLEIFTIRFCIQHNIKCWCIWVFKNIQRPIDGPPCFFNFWKIFFLNSVLEEQQLTVKVRWLQYITFSDCSI